MTQLQVVQRIWIDNFPGRSTNSQHAHKNAVGSVSVSREIQIKTQWDSTSIHQGGWHHGRPRVGQGVEESDLSRAAGGGVRWWGRFRRYSVSSLSEISPVASWHSSSSRRHIPERKENMSTQNLCTDVRHRYLWQPKGGNSPGVH